jgi:hypothetical protein
MAEFAISRVHTPVVIPLMDRQTGRKNGNVATLMLLDATYCGIYSIESNIGARFRQ